MNRQKWLVFITALGLMVCAAALLLRFKASQHLGQPGVKTSPIPGSRNVLVELPEIIPGYRSEPVETQAIVVSILPKDTSFGQRGYFGQRHDVADDGTPTLKDDGFQAVLNVVLMGADRTSLHKPQFCVLGAGYTIDKTETTIVPINRPHHYDLPIIKLSITRQAQKGGQSVTVRGIYLYWYVADGELSGDPSGFDRMWSMAKHLLSTGELQRWAYVTCLAECWPGQEEATYERMKKLIAASVPEFQLVPRAGSPTEVSPVSLGN